MKQPYLVVYDYGQGGVWAFVLAESPERIKAVFRDLDVVEDRPTWLTEERAKNLPTFDVDAPEGWIARLVKQRTG